MKRLFFALIISFFALTGKGFAQQKFPEMHGIRIGMSILQVKRTLPFLKISKPDKYEINDAFLYVPDAKQKVRLPKVFKIELLFLKGKLIRLWIEYYESKKEKLSNYAQFVKLVTKSFNLDESLKTSYRTYEKNAIEYRIGSEDRKEVVLFDLKAKEIRDKQVLESYSK